MPKPIYVFKADLVGFPGVSRTVALRSDQKLLDLHEVLRCAFDWDDDHLYSFWLKGDFWANDGSEYTHPFHAEANVLGPFAPNPPPRSADTRLNRLRLKKGQRIAYLFDFGDEWRLSLMFREIIAADDGPYPRVIETVGKAPPQYPDYDEDAA